MFFINSSGKVGLLWRRLGGKFIISPPFFWGGGGGLRHPLGLIHNVASNSRNLLPTNGLKGRDGECINFLAMAINNHYV